MNTKLRFPSGFQWGTAISAFQTEMGRGLVERPPRTDWLEWATSAEIKQEGLVSGDDPRDGPGFWEHYREDMDSAKELGTNSIRLSIEWARIFPESTSQVGATVKRSPNGGVLEVNLTDKDLESLSVLADKSSVDHYIGMLKYARSIGLHVFLTLYHWPLPVWLHDPVACHKNIGKSSRRGWVDQETIVEFGKYAEYAAKTFGEYVDFWETLNEPDVIAFNGYLMGPSTGFPPALSDPNLFSVVQRNLVFAHNVAYTNIKKHTSAPVGIGVSTPYFEEGDNNPKSTGVVDAARYMMYERVLNGALYGVFDNDFDGLIDERVEGFRGADFIGVDYYTRVRLRYNSDAPFNTEILPCVDCTDFAWDIYPQGMRRVLKWVYEKYRVPIYVTENGIADSTDAKRGRFIAHHLQEVCKSINIDNIPVKGYYHWSLIDNFEWAKGYSMRFGLYEVDYKTKKRAKRRSASVFEEICRSGEIEVET
ncbi:MAG: family 1 glycosylhydrolase [Thermoprotei archaeon]